MLKVRSLAFTYRRRQVLRDVSFAVAQGETLAVVGANGAGKTTLLKVLATLAIPDSGSVTLDGTDVFARPVRYRRQLGYLPESAAFYDDMSAIEYLTYRAMLKGESRKRIRRRIGEAVEMCRLGEFADVPVGRLSSGMRRRVALADAVMLRPRILLLDDFLAGLDLASRRACREMLSTAAQFSAVVATGHELEDLAEISSRMLVLKDGAVAGVFDSSGDVLASVRGIVGGGEIGGEACS